MYGQAIAVGNLGALALQKDDLATSRTCFEQVKNSLYCWCTICWIIEIFYFILVILAISHGMMRDVRGFQGPQTSFLPLPLNDTFMKISPLLFCFSFLFFSSFFSQHLQLVRSLVDPHAEIRAWEMVSALPPFW